MKSGIYAIRCTNGKVYIGSAQNLKKRWTQHRGLLENNAHYNRHLQHSWNKHGSEAFTWDVLEYVEDERLIEREQHYLDLYQSAKREHGFNLYPIAGSPLGRILSDESKEKIRVANLGKKAAPDTRAKMSETRRGKKLSPEWAENIRQSQLGKVISAETRAKLSLAGKGRQLSPETRAKQSAALRGRKRTPEQKARMSIGTREANRRRKAEVARLKAEQRAEATFLRTGIKPAIPENPKSETQGKLFD